MPRSHFSRLLRIALCTATATLPALGVVTPAAAAAGAQPGQSYHGLGFDPDPCHGPTIHAMRAWKHASPYRAAAVYIGGANAACRQTHLSSSWVQRVSAMGWHLIPTYVGLQAPGNSCGCAPISFGHGAAQGATAARAAVADARALGLGPGNPIYYDMEAYTPTPAGVGVTMRFLAAWTRQLHTEGYLSGVYSSASSAIAQLASRAGSGYAEPDELWIASWNGQHNTRSSAVPTNEWAGRRVHQFSGSHNETYGGATLNIDSDYVNGATAAWNGR